MIALTVEYPPTSRVQCRIGHCRWTTEPDKTARVLARLRAHLRLSHGIIPGAESGQR